ncbi:MAG TPA: GGDEF domain-containing protein, partial [Rubrivivax sp.]|nr:GGDEF domain-containing protein [Rubrivivax sp.]
RMLAEAEARLAQASTPGLRQRLLDAQANVQQNLGRFDQAVRLFQESVALADQSAPDWRRSEQRSHLAYTLSLAQQPDQAQEVNARAVELAVAAGDKLALSGAKTTHAIIVSALGRKAEELKAMREAITLAHEAGATRDAVLGIANLSDYYLKQGDFATALKLAREALPLARQVKDHTTESVALTNAGLALISLKRREEGSRLVREAMMIEERTGALTSMSQIQEELGLELEKNGHHREAWAALLEHRRLSDEVFQREQQQALLEVQEAFEADRRKRELATLQTEMGLKAAQLEGRDLQQRLWGFMLLAGTLLLGVVGLLVRRMRRSNAALTSTNAELEVASGRDPLTGLANRRQFQAVMHAWQAGANFQGTLLLIDIDHFKAINDRHGHAVGDAVLVEIAQRLRDTLRAEDLTVRWGGEEFLIVVQDLPPEQVEALAQRLLAAIGGRPVSAGQVRIAVTASIGFATFPLLPQREAQGWERGIELVDTAMYLAKAHGRNRAYGVRSLAAAAAPGRLEEAWREGHADLTLLPGPGAQPLPGRLPAATGAA